MMVAKRDLRIISQPNCLFVEMRNRRRVRVVVIVIAPISAGEEITVHYGSNLWFDCTCNKPTV
ncbi:SET domain [Phytophthora cactorum]|nr:SET domain [Phytophthora cactorum]